MFAMCELISSPAETQLDMEVGFKVFFFTRPCLSRIWLMTSVINERFEKIKMASKMATKYVA